MTEENCNFQQNYNVFGLEDKPCCYLYHKYCDEIDSCYFKRCKRLEQENENLKKEVKQIGSDFIKKGDYARELEQENKELKEKIEAFKTMATVPTRMYNECERERCRYGRALEEIRDYLYTLTTVDNDFPNTETYLRINDKIEEVLNA